MTISGVKILSENDVDQIHHTSLKVLGELGVKIVDREITEKLHGHGCKVEDGRVKFASDLIEEMLAEANGRIVFTGPKGQQIEATAGNTLTHSSSGLPFMIDPDTGQKRVATLRDLKDTIRLMNRLKWLDIPCALVYPSDVPPQINEIKQCETLLRYSEKPFLAPGGSSPKEAKYIVEMIKARAGDNFLLRGNPIGMIGISPESPLHYPQAIVDIMKIVMTAGIPTVMLVAPVVGLSAPMTLAGGLVQMNASMLAFATIAHLINPQVPVIYGARLAFANMRTGSSIWGPPDIGIAGACSVQLARRYGFLSDVYGFSTAACTFDNQAGYEKAINGALPLLAGADIISGFGSLGSILVSSLEQLVIDNETFANLRKVARGVRVNRDTLALDVIADVVGGENYVEQVHTVRHLRSGEVFIPELGFNDLWDEWEQEGQKDIRENAREYAHRLLRETDFVPLPPEVDKELTTIVDAARVELLENA